MLLVILQYWVPLRILTFRRAVPVTIQKVQTPHPQQRRFKQSLWLRLPHFTHSPQSWAGWTKEYLPSRFEHGSSMKALKMSRMSIPTCPWLPRFALRFGSWQVTRMSIETKQARFSHPPISWLHLVGLSLESFWRVTVVQLPLSCLCLLRVDRFHGIGGKNTLRRNDSAQIPLCNPLLHLFGAGQNTWEKV